MYDDEGPFTIPDVDMKFRGQRLDRAEAHPAKKRSSETIADKREAENGGERRRKKWRRRRMEDHFEYIVEAVRIVRPEGTRQLNVSLQPALRM